MKGRRRRLGTAVGAMATAIAITSCGGSGIPKGHDSASMADATGGTQMDSECESELSRLDRLIAVRSQEGSVAEYRIVEARALRDAAAELCIEAQFDLARELIDEATVLLGKS